MRNADWQVTVPSLAARVVILGFLAGWPRDDPVNKQDLLKENTVCMKKIKVRKKERTRKGHWWVGRLRQRSKNSGDGEPGVIRRRLTRRRLTTRTTDI